ncbi:hypothetical protein ECE50_018230 [Chitinophaga sp. Mgbs1]|uniref:Uncharacterized protein n=1 Tax=Chitinophaga solisilvae TaxID=1233460 RepID=A0A3S1CRE7_9BACT|nr:hypothetical protein [Chitinophaga solisilvae]
MKISYQVIGSLMLILAACSKNTDTPVNTELQNNADKVMAFIQSMGYKSSNIVDNGDAYIVAGDVRFPKNMQVPDTKIRTEHRWTGSKLSVANAANIRIKIDSSMTSMTAEIKIAINQWNDSRAPGLHFSLSAGDYDILIKDADLGTGNCGQATFPSGGAAGNLILVNKTYIASHTQAQRQRTIMHEMGHTISLMHTNETEGLLTNSNLPDILSLMNGGQCNTGPFILSAGDKRAVAWLYP